MSKTAKIHKLASKRRWPPRDTTLIDRRGLPVDVSGDIWRLNSSVVNISLNWESFPLIDSVILDALKCYIAHLVKTSSESSTANAFTDISAFVKAPAFQEASLTGQTIPYLAFSQARDHLTKDHQWKLHYPRAMYRWCTRLGFEGFAHSVLEQIADWRIGGNAKGRAVRSQDPSNGPFTAPEVSRIVAGLRAARLSNTMPLDEQAAVALALAFGANAGQYASMREVDVAYLSTDDKTAGWIVSIPRHKKGYQDAREAFRQRKLTGFLGEIVQELIDWNQGRPTFDRDSRPLFRKRALRRRYMITDDWQAHITSSSFTALLDSAVSRLGILGRDGNPMKVTCRRFRYSLASRMVKNGASEAAVADVLDHSDLQNVSVYWEINSDIVEHLDSALTTALTPRAQAFAGIVKAEADAIRGGDSSSRRYLVDPAEDRLEGIGTCGHFGFCNITAPFACYTCVKFQAWMDGPHHEVLEALLQARAARAALGLHPKMVGLEDELIIAVRGTIARIDAVRMVESDQDD